MFKIYDPYKINKEMPLEYLITHCDVISLHVHVTDETKYMSKFFNSSY